jgi:hypothetical protein
MVYIKWSPAGASQNITFTAAQSAQIAAFKKLTIKRVIMPITYYAISSINQTYQLSEGGAFGSARTITAGNYTSAEFCTELSTSLGLASVALGNSATYTCTISSTTGKLTITKNSGTFQIQFATTAATRSQMEKIWGVPAVTAQPQINNGGAAITYTSTNPVILWGPDELLLVSSALVTLCTQRNTDIVGYTSATDTAQTNILFKIPITVTPFSQLIYEDSVDFTATNQSIIPTTIDLNITDESGNSLNFLGGYCYIELALS